MRVIWGSLHTEPFKNESIVAIPFWSRVGKHIIFAGAAGTPFHATFLKNGEKIDANVFFYRDKESVLCFFGAAEVNGGREILLVLSANGEELRVTPPISCNADREINYYLPTRELWDALTVLTPLSEDWHSVLKLVDKEKIAGMGIENKNFLEREIIYQIQNIVSNLDSAGWLGFIDGFDSAHATGWAKKDTGSQPGEIDILVNGLPVRNRFICNKYRDDLRRAGIGSGKFSFDILLDQHSFDSDVLALSLADPETGKVFAFRIFTYDYGRLEYEIGMESFSPEFKGYIYTKDWIERPLELKLYIDDVFYSTCWNTRVVEYPDKQAGADKKDSMRMKKGAVGFSVLSPENLLSPGEHVLRIETHGGRFSREFTFKTGAHLPVPINSLTALERRISIVIPWYNDLCLLECLDCIMRHTPQNIRIFIINDCSTIPETSEIMAKAAANPLVTILENPQNMGFSATVNRGLEAAADDDVIILNQDAMVTPGWLKSLLLTAASAPQVATVTPMSDKAGAFSAPETGNNNPLPPGTSEEDFSRAFRRASFGLHPSVPTGNGFCMYISRACINEIGVLDAERYAGMYGEENDFCMRAIRAGWVNLVDDSTYVFHRRPHSFTKKRQGLMQRAAGLLEERYPEYRNATKIFGSGRDFKLARYAARIAARNWLKLSRPRILYVIAVEGGGTPYTNADLMGEIAESAQCYLLICNSRWMQLKEPKNGKLETLFTARLDQPIEPFSHISPQYDAIIAAWLNKLDIDILHIRLILWHSLNLITVAKKLGIKVVFSLHDFYTISPNLYLVDDAGNFLGKDRIPAASAWRKNLWDNVASPGLPVDADGYEEAWQRRMGRYLAQCNALVTTSAFARELFLATFPEIDPEKLLLIPHGRTFTKMLDLKQPWNPGEKLRILLPGNLDDNKGKPLVEALTAYDACHLDMLEFHSLGRYEGDNPAIVRHGWYKRGDFAKEVGAIRPHASAILSVWSETWCHTLTESWSVGLPTFVLDIGAQAERVKKCGGGWVLPYGDVPDIYDSIIHLATNLDEQARSSLAIAKWQRGIGSAYDVRAMSLRYYSLYRNLLKGTKPGDSGVHNRFIAACTKPGYATSHIRVLEPCANNFRREVTWHFVNANQLRALLEAELVDAALIQRTHLDNHLVDECFRLARSKGIPVTFEFDDDLLKADLTQDSDGEYIKKRNTVEKLIKHSDRLMVSTGELAKRYGSNRSVQIINNRLSRNIWTHEPKKRIEDGYIRALYQGTRSHIDDFLMILPALKKVAEHHPEFRLHLVGFGDSLNQDIAGLGFVENPFQDQILWPYAAYAAFLQSQSKLFDFGIAPLRDTAFNTGKSYLKVLDYGVIGLRTLASAVGPYNEAAHIPHFMSCANTEEAWVSALETLLGLGRKNRRLGAETCDYIQKHYMWDDHSTNKLDGLFCN